MNYIEYFRKRTILTDGKSNTKTAKNSMSTFYLSLQPTDLNSKKLNLCRFSTKECRNACLQFAGRQSFNNVVLSRQRKTEYLINHEKHFVDKMYEELKTLNQKGNVAIRLNLLSDVDWEEKLNIFNKSLSEFSNIQFYDYTKSFDKVYNNKVSNYNLTFSFSGYNLDKATILLKEKITNVAVVFKNSVPLQWNGFDVINGDLSDERFLDEKGCIIGLKYKIPRGVPYVKNKFVIDESTITV